jgi:long-chain acyl-CoA synthetase
MHEFKPTLGYLALTHGVDILPMHLAGTHDALPKGRVIPKRLPLKVRIGPVVSCAEMRRLTDGMARSESYRSVTRLVEQAVRALAEGKVLNTAAAVPESLPEQPEAAGNGGAPEGEPLTNGHGAEHEVAGSLEASAPRESRPRRARKRKDKERLA